MDLLARSKHDPVWFMQLIRWLASTFAEWSNNVSATVDGLFCQMPTLISASSTFIFVMLEVNSSQNAGLDEG